MDSSFADVVRLIEQARLLAYHAVNTVRMAVQEQWKSRELERQYSLGSIERSVLRPATVSPALAQMNGDAAVGVFKGAYSIELLDLQAGHAEADLHSGLLGQLHAFLIELGRDFCFIGLEYPMQVGGRDRCTPHEAKPSEPISP